MIELNSETLNNIINTEPPSLLFHYSSPTGLVGIIKSRQVWATNISFLNDANEIEHAVDYARNAIENFRRKNHWTEEEITLLDKMHSSAGSAAKRIYIFSLTEERDLLSQWRAYCPSSGGYSIGISSKQLKKMAAKQRFLLCKCVYDHTLQYRIVSEIINQFIERYRSLMVADQVNQELTDKISWEFAQTLARFGPILKHPTFKEEKEWRLISEVIDEKHSQIDFRPGQASIIPYFKFNIDEKDDKLENCDEKVLVVVGPTRDNSAAQMAVQFLLTSCIDGGGAHSNSATPYRSF